MPLDKYHRDLDDYIKGHSPIKMLTQYIEAYLYIYIYVAYRNNHDLKRKDMGNMIADLQESISFSYSGINMKNNYIYSAAAPNILFMANSTFSKWRKVLIHSQEYEIIKTQYLKHENQRFASNIDYYFSNVKRQLLMPLLKLELPNYFSTEMNQLFLKYALIDTEELIHKLGIEKNIIWATDNHKYLQWVSI